MNWTFGSVRVILYWRVLAFFVIAFAAVGYAQTTQGANWQVRFKVDSIQPESLHLGELTIVHKGERWLILYKGPKYELSCLYTPDWTLSCGARLPTGMAFLLPPQATGRVPFVPPLSEGLLPWDLYPAPDLATRGLQVQVTNLDAIAEAPHLVVEPASIQWLESGLSPPVREVITFRNGVIKDVWLFSDYRTHQGMHVPGRIERLKRKASGVDIPSDQRIVWTFVAFESPSKLQLEDAAIIANGAAIQDNRDPYQPTHFVFGHVEGPLLEQASYAAENTLDSRQKEQASPWFAGFAAVVGASLGLVASRKAIQTLWSAK